MNPEDNEMNEPEDALTDDIDTESDVEPTETDEPANEPAAEISDDTDDADDADADADAADDNATEPDTDAPDDVAAQDTEDTSDAEDAESTDDAAPGTTEASVDFDGERPFVTQLEYQKTKAGSGKDDLFDIAPAEFTSVAEAKAVVEGFLFSSNEPMNVNKLSKLMNNLHPKTVRGLLIELQWEYANRPGGLQIAEIAGGYQMSTRPHVAPWMFRMFKHKRRSPLSPATLETLAIVAYRQPITKGEIEAVRGVESGAPLRTLQELELIVASGRREVIGRPQLYITTEQFLKVFGLNSLADLPSISELKTRFADEQKLKRVMAEQELPVETGPEPEPATEDATENPDDTELDDELGDELHDEDLGDEEDDTDTQDGEDGESDMDDLDDFDELDEAEDPEADDAEDDDDDDEEEEEEEEDDLDDFNDDDDDDDDGSAEDDLDEFDDDDDNEDETEEAR